MKPLDQDLFHDGADEPGNCFQACVGSILELPLEDVPHFVRLYGRSWMKGFRDWLEERGMGAAWMPEGRHPGGAHCIATGHSPRGEFLHCVVWLNRLVHDPHPSRAGIVGEPVDYVIITAKP